MKCHEMSCFVAMASPVAPLRRCPVFAHRPRRPGPHRRAGVRRPPPTRDAVCSYNVLAAGVKPFFGERPGSEVQPRAGPDTLAGRSNCRPGLRAQRRRPTFRAFRPCPRPRPGPPHTGETPAAGEGRRGRPRRGAGVVERGGLENRCAPCVPWVRIPPSPPKTDFPSLVISTGTGPWGPWSGDIHSSRSKVRSAARERFLHAAPDRVRRSGRNDGEAGGRTVPQFA